MSATIPSYPTSAGDCNRPGKLARIPSTTEPLKRFTSAKKSIGEIYSQLSAYVDELYLFYNEVINGLNFVPTESLMEVEKFGDTIKTIREMFSRDNMKVVFFGRTSNGKSSVINAMLHSKVLPQGMGHTTCCFLQVEGGSGNDKYLLSEDSSERMNIQKLQQLGHAMSEDHMAALSLGQDSLIRVIYPKSASKLLQNDVVILDSPGIDLSPEFDSWIDKHCMDADVFVLVCNAEATITQAEKNFFYRVNAKLSKPNIFILNNRWDASAAEMDHMQQVREQHMCRIKEFLVDDLKVCSEADAKNRIFFISAREMLDFRLKQRGEISHAYQQEGYQHRALEFTNFEAQFERIISKSAIHTKFEAHKRRAREILSAMRNNIDSVYGRAVEQKQCADEEYANVRSYFEGCAQKWKVFSHNYIEEAKKLRNEVHLKVSADFHEEIYRLEAIMDKFDYRFDDNPKMLVEYRKALAEFVDRAVCEDLEARCTGALMQRIWKLEYDMYQKVYEIIAPHTRGLEELWKFHAPFRFSICLNCPSLVADFHEDLEFCFSLGPTALIRRFIAYRSGKPVTAIGRNSYSYALLGDTKEESQEGSSSLTSTQENVVMAQMLLSSASYVANGGLGLIVIGGIVYRTLGWKVIAAGAALYGGLYALERLRWNSGAKEQHYKDQFRSHLSERMRNVASTHTAQCETQALKEMERVFCGLKSTVGELHEKTKAQLEAMRENIQKIERVAKGLNQIKGKTTFLSTDLDRFESDYLKLDSPLQ
ncbi:hypothetical protein AB6A40_002918 [Gnathostoma spinigerum]|uniref:Dynamin-type G domain-containing protein n=1 Tax=Gnathostoma spinigerum TaxID=75299 RepID=A0ABD6EDI1_9BILA